MNMHLLSAAAAELQMNKRVTKLTSKMSVEELTDEAAKRWSALQAIGRRMLTASADLGVALAALKQVSPHGTFEGRLDTLGISKKTAHRLRQLALYREALPSKPPASLGVEVWTDKTALEFGQVLEEIPDDLPPDDRVDEAVKRVRSKRTTVTSTNLSGRVMRLQSEIAQALNNGGLGAEEAVEAMRNASKNLTAMLKTLNSDE